MRIQKSYGPNAELVQRFDELAKQMVDRGCHPMEVLASLVHCSIECMLARYTHEDTAKYVGAVIGDRWVKSASPAVVKLASTHTEGTC